MHQKTQTTTPITSSLRARPAGPNGAYRLEGQGESVPEANAFLNALELRGLSPRTVRAYAMDLVVLFRWLDAKPLSMKALTEAGLLDFVGTQREANAQPRSINRRLTTARLLYRFITDSEMSRGTGASTDAPHFRGRGRDKHLGIRALRPQRRTPLRVKVPRTLVEPLEPNRVQRFLQRCTRYRDAAIVYLMLLCGLRSREILNLRLQDVSFDAARLRIWGKGSKERAMPLPKLLLQLLHDYVELERPDSATEALFLILKGPRRGRPMTVGGLRSLFRHRRKEAELAPANAHRFRHTFGTDMARAGVRLPILQRMMGHAHAETTLQYVNLSTADVVDAYRKASKRIQARYRGKRGA